MKASELNFKEGFGLTEYKKGEHCTIAIENTFFMPATKAQLQKFLKLTLNRAFSEVLMNQTEINQVAEFMKKYGFEANFMYTKSKQFVRLKNFEEFKKALKIHFKQ